MSTNPLVRGRTVFLAVSILAGALAGCRGETPSAPESDLALEASAAKGGKPITGTSGITVSAVDPDTVSTDTIITVRVLGSGFTAGSAVSWELAGVPTESVKTQPPVLFISSRELQARIVVAQNASLARYDAVVTAAGGKKGIGVEKLEVVSKPIALPLPAWAGTSTATDVNDQGVIVGFASDGAGVAHPLRWTLQGGGDWAVETMATAGTAAGVSTTAWAINNRGDIILHMNRSDGSHWASVLTANGGEEVVFGDYDLKEINDNGTVVGLDYQAGAGVYGVAWRRIDQGTWTGPIPVRSPQGYRRAADPVINNRDEIAGALRLEGDSESAGPWVAVWRYESGQWTDDPVLIDQGFPGTPNGINNLGALAGRYWPCTDATCLPQGAFWPSAEGTLQVLPADYTSGRWRGVAMAYDLNDSNLVAGFAPVWFGKGSSTDHATVWHPGLEEPKDLGAFQSHQSSAAWAINNGRPAVAVGWIGGSATAWIVF